MAKWIATAEWADSTKSECTPRSRRDAEKWARSMRDVALVRHVGEPVAQTAGDVRRSKWNAIAQRNRQFQAAAS